MTGEHRWGRFCHRWHLCEQDLQGAMAACGWRSVRKRCLWSSFTVFKVSEWDLKFQDARMVSSCSAKKHSVSGPGLIMPQKCQVVRKLDGREATPRPVVLCCVNQHSGCRNYSASEPRTDVNGFAPISGKYLTCFSDFRRPEAEMHLGANGAVMASILLTWRGLIVDPSAQGTWPWQTTCFTSRNTRLISAYWSWFASMSRWAKR